GAPALLGGFAAGLALSSHFFPTKEQKEFSHQVETAMKPIIHLFSPIFFVTIGLSLDLKSIDWESGYIWSVTGLLLAGAIFGKAIAGYFTWNEPFKTKTIIGTAMVPRGEVGLIFANIGLTTAIIKEDLYAALILVIAITTLLAPLCLRALYGYEKRTVQ
ncbi:MAG: cation:proton antiporter, partial [Parachlamydiaceae bacterium]